MPPGWDTLRGVTRMPVGYRRTGLCPTFACPSLQRDGYLLRLPLVGGLLDRRQVGTVAEVSQQYGSGVVELTNRGNLQVRGLQNSGLASALEACQAVGLGELSASLVTISPFATAADHALRNTLLDGLQGLDVQRLAPKFAVHVDDPEGTTADRAADVLVRLGRDGECELTLRGIGTGLCLSPHEVSAIVRRLVERCIAAGPQVRTADLVQHEGAGTLATALAVPGPWLPYGAASPRPAPRVGLHPLPSGEWRVLVGARFGRVAGADLAGIGDLLQRHALPNVKVTPWRAFALACTTSTQADSIVASAAALGLLTRPDDPAAGVIACIGARGCWQTELDTLDEAERFVANRPAQLAPGALVHVSGCDKRCATRGDVALTLLGRADQSGFDTLVSPAR
jgi:precorrin-3B synthase